MLHEGRSLMSHSRERIPVETKQYPDMECDVVIAGCGVAGLYAALNLPTSTRVIMLSKGTVDECDSMLAQGGICVLPEGSDYDAFFEDTMHAGHYENRRESVDIMIRSSRSVINDLLAMGVDFERKADGSLDFTREGAHSRPRIAFHADITGKEITTKLLQAVRKLDNVQILEHVAMTDILTAERDGATVCTGVVAVAVDAIESLPRGVRIDALTQIQRRIYQRAGCAPEPRHRVVIDHDDTEGRVAQHDGPRAERNIHQRERRAQRDAGDNPRQRNRQDDQKRDRLAPEEARPRHRRRRHRAQHHRNRGGNRRDPQGQQQRVPDIRPVQGDDQRVSALLNEGVGLF